jgi:hypothetical protein
VWTTSREKTIKPMFKEENAQQAVDKSVDLEEYTGQMGTH